MTRPTGALAAATLIGVLLGGALGAQTAADPSARLFAAPDVLKALQRAYPDVITDIFLEGGDWRFWARGEPFSWANGRLLPLSLSAKWTSYAPQPFYPYTALPLAVESWPKQQTRDVENQLMARKTSNVVRNAAFYDTVWRIHNRSQADDRQKKIKLFGLTVTMHQDLEASLKRIEATVVLQSAEDRELATFLKGLKRLEGFNWRDIAGTQSRSNHAYGTALDLIPRSYGGKNVYWMWAIGDEPGWYQWAWSRRWQPPAALVKAFEDEGWVWGGKWVMFDTIHFEYRPEILMLNGLR